MAERGSAGKEDLSGEWALCAASKFTLCNDTDGAHKWQRPRVCLMCWLQGYRPVGVEREAQRVDERMSHEDAVAFVSGQRKIADGAVIDFGFKPSETVYTIVSTKGSTIEVVLMGPNDALDDARAEATRMFGPNGYVSIERKDAPS